MKHFISILSFLISASVLHLEYSIKNKSVLQNNLKVNQAISLCGVFSNKSTFETELISRVLNLKCDSTYTFEMRSCICGSSSYGIWYKRNGTIYLKTSEEVLAKSKEKPKGKVPCWNHRWPDFTGTTIVINDSLIVWKLSENQIDTLYRD